MTLERIVVGSLIGLATFGAASHVILFSNAHVPAISLPIALALGFWVARTSEEPCALTAGQPCPRWLTAITWFAIGGAFLVLLHGAIATPARHWDGTTSWWLRTQVLRDDPTLDHTFFTQSAVYGHSREYPLLQPLLQASIDRIVPGLGGIVLPLMFALLVGCCAIVWRAWNVAPTKRAMLVLAIGLMPMWVAPTSGAVDSGFAEVSLAAAVTAMFAGIARSRSSMIFTGAMLAVLLKPEGAAYPLVIGTALWLVGTHTQLRAITYGWSLGMLLWMPIYLRLSHSEVSPWIVVAAVVAVAVLVLKIRAATDPLSRPRTVRTATLVAVVGIGLAILGAFHDDMQAVQGVLGMYLQGGLRAIERLDRIPSILGGLAAEMFHVRKFGLTFGVIALLAITQRRWRVPGPSTPVALALALGLAF
ncbi:MAG: hypothetical protein KDB80_06765, partial [Planctomycetes bacterium]|nr:hypothetical protein [Planctomycetota bacterium]